KIMEQVSFTAGEEDCHQSKWPKAFAHAFYWGNRQMKVGNFDRATNFVTMARRCHFDFGTLAAETAHLQTHHFVPIRFKHWR
ncbi:hypothetical protein, partial [Pseudomonas viridiflava]|uniref:hypothetical protein n=1 Tax=Pseudomonas viridiflava TaxID=33069 RepID=UPI0019801EB4